MPLAPALSMSLATDPQSYAMHIWAGGRDITADVQWDSVRVEDAGANVRSTTSLRINGRIADYPEVYDQALLRVYDATSNADVSASYIRSRRPTKPNSQYDGIDLIADDAGGLLDDAFIPFEARPAETMQARIGFLWGKYAGSHLSGDLSLVASIGGSLPAQSFAGVTLRQAVETTISQASSSADYYLDANTRLHIFTSESNAAPKDIDADAPGAGEVAPMDLSIDYDSNTYYNRVYIQAATPAASGFYQNEAAIAAANGVVRTNVVNAPDCETAAMAASLAAMYLGRVKSAKGRGSFSVTSDDADGWRAGQNVLITSADLGLSAQSFRISRVITTVLRPGTSMKRRYEVEFGGSRASGNGISSEGLGSGQLVSGNLGGASNVYVTSDGVAVTDGL